MNYQLKFSSYPKILEKNIQIKLGKKNTDDEFAFKHNRILGPRNSICETCKNYNCKGHIGIVETKQNNKFYPTLRIIFQKSELFKFILKAGCVYCYNLKSKDICNLIKKIENNNNKITKNDFKYFLNYRTSIINKKISCENESCKYNSIITSINYNKNQFEFKYRSKNKNKDGNGKKEQYTKITNKCVYKLFKNLSNIIPKLFYPKTDFELTAFFNKRGIVVPPNNVILMSNYKLKPSERFTKQIENIIYYKENELKLNISVNSLIHKPNKNYNNNNLNIPPIHTILSNSKNSSINKNIIGQNVAHSLRGTASPHYGKAEDILISKNLANFLLYADTYNDITKNFIMNNIENNKYKYLIKPKSGSNENIVVKLDENFKTINVKYGDILLRNIDNGDVCLLGRNPSLWEYSRFIGRIKICDDDDKNNWVIALSILVIFGLNCDFDGDSLPLFVLMNDVARVEGILKMSFGNYILNNINGNFIMGLVQESVLLVDNIYQMKNIPKEVAYYLLGEYAYLIEEEKNTYNGNELLSLFIPEHLTYPNYFDNGKLIKDKVINKDLVANNDNSIMTILTKLHSIDCAKHFLEGCVVITQKYNLCYGFTIRNDNIYKLGEELKYIKKETNKINKETLKKLNDYHIELDKSDNKMSIIRYNSDINSIIQDRSNKIIESLKKVEFNGDSDNYFKEHNNLYQLISNEIKITKNDFVKQIYLSGDAPKTIEHYTKGICGKVNNYDLTHEDTLNKYGIIENAKFDTLNLTERNNECIHIGKEQIKNRIQGTPKVGSFFKKTLRTLQSLRVNSNKSWLNDKDLIKETIFNGFSFKDLYKVKIYSPDKNIYRWYYELDKLYNQIKPYILITEESKLIYMDYIYYPFDIESYVQTNYYVNKEIKKNNLDDEEITAKDIIDFWKDVQYKYFYNLYTTKLFCYVTLLYFDLSKTHLKNYSGKLSKRLFNKFKDDIIIKLMLSIDERMNAVQAGTLNQNNITQRMISTHLGSGGSDSVHSAFNKSFDNKKIANKNKHNNTITLITKDNDLINDIINYFEYLELKSITIENKFIENTDNNVIYFMKIPLHKIKETRIDVFTIWLMLKNFLDRDNYVEKYYIYFNYIKDEKMLTIHIKLIFNESSENERLKFELLLKSKPNKGVLKNAMLNDVIIDYYGESHSIIVDIDSLKYFKYLDTSKAIFILYPIYLEEYFFGINKQKLSALYNANKVLGQDSYPSNVIILNLLYSKKEFKNIKELSSEEGSDNNKHIIAEILNNGIDSFTKNCIKENIDPCINLESCAIVNKRPKVGRSNIRIVVDFEKYNILHEVEDIKNIESDEDIEIF